jgi:uncharacterized protein YfiM (DUF2279 family)
MLKYLIRIISAIVSLFPLISKGQVEIIKPDSVNMDRRAFYKVVAIESAYYITAIFVMQKIWYKDRNIVPFHFYDDTQGYLQVDKFGHAFGSYVESYLAYQYLRKSGVSKTKALIYGGSLGLILQTPIEIMDGIHEGYGFSWSDMAANTIGSGLVVGQELLFNEQIVKYKFSYWESSYSQNANGFLGVTKLDRLLKDYNGHTYWFSMPINKIIPNHKIPSWLSIAVGYGANGMYGENENISDYQGVNIPSTVRYRQYLLSLDFDLTKIKTNSKALKAIFQGLSFIKLPFPTLEFNSKGGLKGYWLY